MARRMAVVDEPASPVPLAERPSPRGAAPVSAIVLAAGQGVRMRSRLPKVLHAVAGRPMINHVVAAMADLEPRPSPLAVVVGPDSDAIRDAVVTARPDLAMVFPIQAAPRGTGHAALQAAEAVAGRAGTVLVACGDAPLLGAADFRALLDQHDATGDAITVLTAALANATGYGRVVRSAGGTVAAIVEEADADAAQRAITEVNTGAYAFRDAWLWPALAALAPAKSGELYLTDLVARAIAEGETVGALRAADHEVGLGINTRAALARAESAMRHRIRERHLAAGVTLVDPETTWIDAEAEIGQDTVVWPGTHVLGATRIGRDCRIGPNAVLRDARLGDRVTVTCSVVEDAEIGDASDVGPYAHLRAGTRLAAGVHVGNFAEIKNSTLATGVRFGHFGYLGDATIGRDANIGAGTVTCNFDGRDKHPTTVGAHAFIGSDTMLVAPVRVGDRARTGAGSVVTRDVPADATVVGVPARPIRSAAAPDASSRAQDPA